MLGGEEEMLEAVAEGRGPVILAEEALSLASSARLELLLDEQPSWSDLPLILLTRPGRPGPESLRTLVRRRNSVRALTRPVDPQALLGLARLALESRGRQVEVRDLLQRQRELNDQLSRRTAQLRELTLALMGAEDRERRRLARLLHDDLQQVLVGAHLHLSTAERLSASDEGVAGALRRVRELLGEAQEKSRVLSHDIFPAVLQSADLSAVLRWLADHCRDRLGLGVTVDERTELGDVDDAVIRFVYRAAQELLLNVAKHSGAEHARVEASRQGDRLRVSITDEGCGFAPTRIREGDPRHGLGLWSIRERSQTLGGRLEIDSAPGRGARLELVLPAERAL
jgi:signal transduction histidine kinase